MKSRAYTKREVKGMLFRHMKAIAKECANNSRTPDVLEKIEQALFSLLVVFDGESIALPAMDIVLRPHPTDQNYHTANGENYFEDGMILNDDEELHHEFCNFGK